MKFSFVRGWGGGGWGDLGPLFRLNFLDPPPCDIGDSCDTADSCDSADSCDIGDSCDIADSCDTADSCDIARVGSVTMQLRSRLLEKEASGQLHHMLSFLPW